MLDIKFIRNHPEKVKKAISAKKEKGEVDKILELDEQKRKKIVEVEELKGLKNTKSKEIAELKRAKKDAAKNIEEMTEISSKIKELDSQISELNQKLESLLLWVPNIPEEGIPEGDESQNKEIRSWGKPSKKDFKVLPHWEIGKKLGIMEVERAAKISGSGFVVLTGKGARLQRALINFMLDTHINDHGYKEVSPCHLINRSSLTYSAQIPKLESDMYHIDKDDLFLIPTSEVYMINLFQNETLAVEQLPIYFTAASSCFRREAGAAGKDTRGLLRVHEFKKVEMIACVEAENSNKELDKMVANAETILQRLEIPYRVVLLASGDMSFASVRTYDLEIWSAGVEKWLEVSSCSNCTDFQSRRANIRYKKKKGKPKFVHLLNGSGVALPRLMSAILENYQLSDGKVEVPKALRPYLGNEEIL